MKNLRNSFMELGIPESRILENESMAKHISFRVGGCADYYVNCTDRKELSSLLSFLTEEGVPHMLIGNGSNLLFRDSGYRGVIIHLEGEFQDCEVQGDTVIAGSGKLLSSVSSLAAKSGLAGGCRGYSGTDRRADGKAGAEAAGEFSERGKHLQASGGRIRGSADSGIRIEGRFRRRCRGIGEAFRFHHQQGRRHGDGCAAADGAGREEGI